MYCPRCGSQNTDATKFCRNCGLSLAQVTDYVAAGGTGALGQPTSPPPPLMETSEMLALKHKRILTILSVCIGPVVFAAIGDSLRLGDIVGIPFLLIPIGIVWASFRYKMQLRRLQERQLQEYHANQQSQQTATPKLIIQPPPNQPPIGQPRLDAPRTNPLAELSQGSVVEDETRKFQER
jgi:zinc-ribbon domain